MEWPTLLASAGISALVGTLVSLAAVSQTTVRRAKAERADAARQAVRRAVEPLLADLARYSYAERPEPKRGPERSHMDDHAQVVTIRTAAAELPSWRRAMVDRRCRRVFGDYWTDLARDFPTSPDDGGTVSAWFAANVRDGRPVAAGQGPLDGLMQRAYSRPPGDPLARDLRRELRRLAAAR